MTTPTSRRSILRSGGALFGGALGAGTLGSLLAARPAQAADYKALVCVFLYGGNDGMNNIVPSDSTRHGQYAAVRGALALPRSSLAPLAGSDYGLHPAMAALQAVWDRGDLAPVFNIGPLNRPLTKDEYRAAGVGATQVPASLFSHSDQQIEWESATSVSITRTGWGGRGSAVLGTTNPVISVGGNGHFGVEDLRAPLVLPGPGSDFGAYGLRPEDIGWTPNLLRKQAVDALYATAQNNPLADAYRAQQQVAFDVSARLADLVAALPGDALSGSAIDTAFAPITAGGEITTDIGAQLYQIAKLVAGNTTVQGTRQMFFAQKGGFDTHNGQVDGGGGASATTGYHAMLLKDLADAMAAFNQAMVNLGLSEQVTLFTQSDFGRTFVPNSSQGTDHAWGNHQFVMGGAVKGRLTYGTYPRLVVGGPDDVGVDDWELQGRWIPTTSVDQYAATLLSWFGASGTQLDQVLPNLVNFGSARTLGFL